MLEYLIFMLPALLFGLYAQFRVKTAYAEARGVPARSGLSGAKAAQVVLRSKGLNQVDIEEVPGVLSDHYDPRSKVLRLSNDVYESHSLAAVGVAAHEAGHAIQDAERYGPLVIRNGIVPMASFGSNMSFFFIFLGAMLGSFGMVLLGVALFSVVVLFQLINLPVEFNASARAKSILMSSGLISPEEERTVSKVLDAAALTYVAATVSAVLTLLYYLLRLGVLGGRER